MLRPGNRGRPLEAPETSRTLLIRVRDLSDAEAWREFDVLYRPLVRSYARSRGVAGHDLDDVVQEVFRRLVRALPDYTLDPRRGRFRTWLYEVTRNATTDWLQTRGRACMTVGDPNGLPERAGDSPEAEWYHNYQQRVLEIVLERVRSEAKPRDWSAFEQHLLLRRRALDVAGALGISVENVYKITSRVFAKVRDLCLEFDEDLGDGTTDLPG